MSFSLLTCDLSFPFSQVISDYRNQIQELNHSRILIILSQVHVTIRNILLKIPCFTTAVKKFLE